MSNHVTQQADDLENNINQLEDTMHEAQQFRTLEEQVEDMKRRGINPRDNFKKWDEDEEDNWGSNSKGEVKPIQMDDGEEPTPPPIPHCQNSCHPHPNNPNGGKGDNHGTIQCRTQTSNIKQTAIA